MKLESIAIRNLFGYYSYDINLDDKDQLFIITGLNGSGKTTVMKILHYLSIGKLDYFYGLPFDTIDIKVKNEQDPLGKPIHISIVKQDVSHRRSSRQKGMLPDTNVRPDHDVVFRCFTAVNGKEKKISEAVLSKKNIERALPYSIHGLDFFFDGADEMTLNYPAVDRRNFVIDTKNIGKNKGIPFTFYSSTLKVKFIEAQRLLMSEHDEEKKQDTSKATIKDVAGQLEKHLKEARYDFLDESQKKSNKLIETLLENTGEGMTEEDYNKAREELMPTVDELKSYNLASETIFPYDSRKKDILTVYIQDQKAKLEIFSDVLRELNLFSFLLKRKRFAHKEIVFSPQYGLKAYTDKGESISLENLSSGEQNEIILLYKLIFDVASDVILLVDEPEISLHVIWQEEFMSDLEEIAKVRKQQIIIATHSPQIIGNRWKMCYDLTESNLNR